MTTPAKWFQLRKNERNTLNRTICKLREREPDLDITRACTLGPTYAPELPIRLRRLLAEFKLSLDIPAIVISGLPIDNIKPTPSNVPASDNHRSPTDDEIVHIIIASYLGQVFAWDSIQNGNIINHIIPVIENSLKLISSNYDRLFDFHTEDAFHPLAGDYLALSCIRNPSKVPTLISFLGDIDTESDWAQPLFNKKFFIHSNIAHNVDRIQKPSPILFGDVRHPYVRFNRNSMSVIDEEQEATKAVEIFYSKLTEQASEVILKEGDAIYIDNFRTMHARPPYKPKFKGSDRWLKRLYVSSLWRKIKATQPNSTKLTLEGDYDPYRPIADY
jgi:hypothetical protein